VEETLEHFLRRVRLERAAYMLIHSNQTVLEISADGGYQSPEAFSRSFRKAFGCLPTLFRKGQTTWELPSPSNLHWNADWDLEDGAAPEWGESVVSAPARFACVWRAIGNYSQLSDAWRRFDASYRGQIPATATFVTVYLDNMWTHPVCETMRADIGWLCAPTAIPPRGMRRIYIPGGCYAVSRLIDRPDRHAAWSYMNGRHAGSDLVSYDEYSQWPLPFEQVKTRIYVGLKPRNDHGQR
jgi:AraC family transcriptional regulator